MGEAMTSVTQALLARDRQALQALGIYRLTFEDIGPVTTVPANGGASRVERELTFRLLYEFTQVPVEAGDVIERIPIDFELGRGTAPKRHFQRDLGEGSLAFFQVMDDASANANSPSQWQENSAEERIEQLSSISGGPAAATSPAKPGTYLVLRETPTLPPVGDFILRATLRSGSAGGLGLVFRFRDTDNFYFFLMSVSPPFRMMGRKRAGIFEPLETAASDTSLGFTQNQLHDLKLTAEGSIFRVFLDGDPILEGRDTAFSGPGRVGLMSRNNNQAFFYRFSVAQF
jgi:hypothetical protein